MDDQILAPVDKEDPTSHMPSAGLGALIGERSGNLVAGEQGFPEFFTSPRLSAHAATWPSLSFPPRVYVLLCTLRTTKAQRAELKGKESGSVRIL